MRQNLEVEDFSQIISPIPQIHKKQSKIYNYSMKDTPPRESTIQICNQPNSVEQDKNMYIKNTINLKEDYKNDINEMDNI